MLNTFSIEHLFITRLESAYNENDDTSNFVKSLQYVCYSWCNNILQTSWQVTKIQNLITFLTYNEVCVFCSKWKLKPGYQNKLKSESSFS